MSKVVETAAAFKAARAGAKARVAGEMEQRIHDLTAEEMARLSVEMHKAFNDGMTKEQLRTESGLYRSPLFDKVWEAVPYTGREVRPGRAGVTYASSQKKDAGRYRMQIVTNDQSTTGKGLLITTFEGEALPEPVTFKIMSRDNGTFFIMGSPDFPEWWDKMMRDGEYARFNTEVNEFLRREMEDV